MNPERTALISRLRTQPDDVDAYEALKVDYHSDEDFASLANLVEGWADRCADPNEAADAFHEAARTVSYYLDDQIRAIDLLERALDRSPAHAEALADLEQLLDASVNANARATSLERRAERLTAAGADPALIAAAYYELGETWEKALERPDRAIVHFRAAYELDPEHVPAMYAAREIYRRSGEMRAAAKVYELEIRAEPDPLRSVMLMRELATLQRQSLDDLDSSVATLEQAFERAPRDLEVTYELAGALLARAGVRGDSALGLDDRRRASSLLVRLAQVSEGEAQVAFLESALDASPDHDEALSLLERIAPSLGVEDRLPLRVIRYIAYAPNGPNITSRRVRAAAAYEAADQLADAIACLEPISESDPEITKKYASLLEANGRPVEANKARRKTLRTLSDADKVDFLRKALDAANEAEANGADADEAARELLALESTNERAIETRLAYARAIGDAETSRALLLPRSADTTRAERLRAEDFRELLALADGPLSDPALAAKAREALESLSPGDRDTRAKLKQQMRLGQRWNELASVLAWEAVNEDDLTAQRNAALSLDELTTRAKLDPQRAIATLDVVYRALGSDSTLRERLLERRLEENQFVEAVPLLESKADDASSPTEANEFLERAARYREDAGDLRGGARVRLRMLELAPSDVAIADRALDLAEQASDAELLARVLLLRANRDVGEARASWLERLASLRANALDDKEGALDALRLATEAVPNDERRRLSLEAALLDQVHFEELRDSIGLRAASANGEDRIALLREMARISTQNLEDEEGARSAYRAIRAMREDEAALSFLIDSARERGENEELILLLTNRLDSSADAATRTTSALELARLLDGATNQQTRAKEVLESVRTEATEPFAVLTHLLALYEREGDDAGVAHALADLLDVERDEKASLALAMRLHELASKRLDDDALTAKALARWSEVAPAELTPLEALVAMHIHAGRERDAGAALVELAKRLDSPSDAEAKLLEATTRFESAGDLGAAMDAARLAQQLAFGSVSARDRLGELAEKASRFDIVLEVKDARARELLTSKSASREERIAALLACAEVARTKLANVKHAEAYTLKASELAEGDARLTSHVEESARALDRSAGEADAALERALVTRLLARARAEEGDARIPHLERAAKILSEAMGEHQTAYELLANETVEDPAPALLRSWVHVAVRHAKVNELASTLNDRFSEAVDRNHAVALLEASAELYNLVQRASEEADVLRRLFTMRGTTSYRDRLSDALARAGRNDDRMMILEQAIRRATGDERDELARSIAKIWDAERHDKNEAVDAWKRVLRFVPNDAEAIAALERLGARRPTTLSDARTQSHSVPPPAPSAAPSTTETTSVNALPTPMLPPIESHATPVRPIEALSDALDASRAEPTMPRVSSARAADIEVTMRAPLATESTTRAPSMPPPAMPEEVEEILDGVEELDFADLDDELVEESIEPKAKPRFSAPPPPPRARD